MRPIDVALRGSTSSVAYVDDTLVFSQSFEDLVRHLRQTLELYRQAKMQPRKDKCIFAVQEIEFVRHLISPKGHRPLPAVVQIIREYPAPSSLRELKSFLGLINYYRDFIDTFSEMASPLYELTQKSSTWKWGDNQENSFLSLRSALVSMSVCLRFPQWNITFYVECDASKEGRE